MQLFLYIHFNPRYILLDLEVRIFLLLNRQQDVRATEIDKVDMHASFRPGDIVKALVVSFIYKDEIF